MCFTGVHIKWIMLNDIKVQNYIRIELAIYQNVSKFFLIKIKIS